MAIPTIHEICDAIKETFLDLVTTGDLTRADNFDELTEGMNDPKILQIYPEGEAQVDSFSGIGQTQKMTLGGTDGLHQEDFIIHLDYYCRQRSNLGDDMAALIDGIDAIRLKLIAQKDCPPFGLAGIRTFQWSWSRVVFSYGNPETHYVGARFILNMRIF